jgi:hypothetical protein
MHMHEYTIINLMFIELFSGLGLDILIFDHEVITDNEI